MCLDGQLAAGHWEDVAMACWKHKFRMPVGCFVGWFQLPLDPTMKVSVLRQLRHSPEGVTSDHDLVPFDNYLAQLGAKPEKGAASKQSKPVLPILDPKLVDKYPWLLSEPQTQQSSSQSVGAVVDLSDDEKAPVVDLTDDQLTDLYKTLEEKRAEWAAQGVGVGQGRFKIQVLKGAWVMQATGQAFKAAKGFASGADCESWCVQYGLGKTATYEMSLYGESQSLVLARAWCSKMSYLYEVWLNQPDPDYVFTGADVSGWSAPQEFIDLLGVLSGRQKTRALALQKLRPTNK